ncbi:putative GTP-binding protein YjiA [Anaerohalosphaera lusitana]|uniref:Putative GTP-binding protein YjiA n=1 Tax=Anaerohalosphaera lusitana TaxID=1936003 RepID=A0A1U9NR57_9BACT|nr:GTP-binding protein [Anaerohalosphaera lusitana]AQT70006.1 putative GTP-binding protein YjiA [Anaerohalosphaera lusitana]
MSDRIDVYILTGYLGAGKTTVLNHLLEDGGLKDREVALVINEFGKVGVDGSRVRDGDYAKFEINKGSIFCICTKTEMLKAFTEIAENARPDAVIVEATGIAEVRDFENILAVPELLAKFQVRANVCVVDALNYSKVAPHLRVVNGQVGLADGIVINKCDLVSDEAVGVVRKIVSGVNGRAKIVTAERGKLLSGFVDGLVHAKTDGEAVDERPADVYAVSFRDAGRMDREAFERVTDELGERLLRLKGNIDFGDGAEYVEVVYDQVSREKACGKLGAGTTFTAIGWKVDKDELRGMFEGCVTG